VVVENPCIRPNATRCRALDADATLQDSTWKFLEAPSRTRRDTIVLELRTRTVYHPARHARVRGETATHSSFGFTVKRAYLRQRRLFAAGSETWQVRTRSRLYHQMP
jgi:hypothetical protein